MPGLSHEPTEARANSSAAKSRATRFQFGLRSLFLLVAATAVWTTYFSNRHRITALEAGITTMRPLAHELVVNDADKIAVVKLEELWYDDNRWEVSLPDVKHRLCLATREIDTEGLAPVMRSEAIEAGRHSIYLKQREDGAGWLVTAGWDGSRLLLVQEPKEWNPGSGSTGGGHHSQCTQSAVDEPLILFRRRFSLPSHTGQVTTPPGPTEGILLWIEPIPVSRNDQ